MALHKPPSGARIHSDGSVREGGGELAKRAIGGAIVFASIVGGIMMGGWVWAVIASLAALGSLIELYKLLSDKYKISKGLGVLGGIAILSTVSVGYSFALSLSIIPITAFCVIFTEVVRRQTIGSSYALWNVGGTIFGLVYVVLPWSFMIAVRNQTWGNILLFTLFGCTWACDVAAYVVGSRLGSAKLCSRVSPNKSWEGFWGGLVAAAICGVGLAIFFEFPPIPLLILGAICGVVGQLGDLGESVLKREANVKDTGNAIPGHGGFLDRFDSILINATLAFFVFEAIG